MSKEIKEITEIPDLKEFQALDTTVVQVRSVLNFMYTLGYSLDMASNKGRMVSYTAEQQGNRFLSFNTAVAMHNLGEADWSVDQTTGQAFPSVVKLRVGFAGIAVRLAIASKLVKKAKIATRKNGQLDTKSVMVKPTNAAVLKLVEPA